MELFLEGHREMRGGGESGFDGDAFYGPAGVFDEEALGVFEPEAQDVLVRGLSAVLEKKAGEVAEGDTSQGLQLLGAQLVGQVVLNEGLHAFEDHAASKLQVFLGVHSLGKVADGIEHACDKSGKQRGGVCLREAEISRRYSNIDQLAA